MKSAGFALPANLNRLIILPTTQLSSKPVTARSIRNLDGTGPHKKHSRSAFTQEDFERLLDWLDLDRETAGNHYENIRSELIGRFRAHGCATPEDLADETINRVARKLREIGPAYIGDRRPYFYRVAHYVHLEYLRGKVEVIEIADDIATTPRDNIEPEFACLDRCLSCLPDQNREIIVTYYQGERRKKIELRKHLAASLQIELPMLRLKAQRIRQKLKRCILDCLEAAESSMPQPQAISRQWKN